jgi:protein-S-isoprenylcysteine O-methyltransferase Ste14
MVREQFERPAADKRAEDVVVKMEAVERKARMDSDIGGQLARWLIAAFIAAVALMGLVALVAAVVFLIELPGWVQMVGGVVLALGTAGFAWLVASALGSRSEPQATSRPTDIRSRR